MKQKNKTTLQDILWFLLFIILVIIPGLIMLFHPVIISTYYGNPGWLLLYFALPIELYAFFIYFMFLMKVVFK